MVDEDYDTLVTQENLKLINKLFCSPLSLKEITKSLFFFFPSLFIATYELIKEIISAFSSCSILM